jgi:hypothetical protein
VGGERFDRLSRSFGMGCSRRRLLRGVLGFGALAAAGRRVEAGLARAYRGPGEPCKNDSQCLGADVALVCAWNGIDHDATMRCCANEGDRCGSDEACCGYAICAGDYCTDMTVAPIPGCIGAGCPCEPGWYGDDPCDDGLVCCQSESGVLMCLPLYTCSS